MTVGMLSTGAKIAKPAAHALSVMVVQIAANVKSKQNNKKISMQTKSYHNIRTFISNWFLRKLAKISSKIARFYTLITPNFRTRRKPCK